MGGRAPKGPFKGISTQKTGQGKIVGRLKCPARKCQGDALAKVDGMGWLQATHQGCTSLTGRSYEAARDILERVSEYPSSQKWATATSEAEAMAALKTLLEPETPKPPSGPTFVETQTEEKQPIELGEEFIKNAEAQIEAKAKKEIEKPAAKKRSRKTIIEVD